MFNVVFYSSSKGESQVASFLDSLEAQSATIRDARIQYRQAKRCIHLLKMQGFHLGTPYTDYLCDGIWELRPGCNRILFFFFRDNTFVLLHQFTAALPLWNPANSVPHPADREILTVPIVPSSCAFGTPLINDQLSTDALFS